MPQSRDGAGGEAVRAGRGGRRPRARRTGRRGCHRRGGRWRRQDVHLQRPGVARRSRPRRGRPRRVRASPGAGRRPRRRLTAGRDQPQADCGARQDGRATPAAARAVACTLDRRPLPRPASGRHPGNASAGAPRATRSRRRAEPERPCGRSSARGCGSPGPAGAWTAGGPRDGRAGRSGGLHAAAPRPRRDGPADARLDPLRRGRRTSIRTLDRGDGGGSRDSDAPRDRRTPTWPTTRPPPGGRPDGACGRRPTLPSATATGRSPAW